MGEFGGKYTCHYCELDYNAGDNIMTLTCGDDIDECPAGMGSACMDCEHVKRWCSGCWKDTTGEDLWEQQYEQG